MHAESDARLVHDEHTCLAHARTTPAAKGASGSASTNVAPWPRLDSAQTRPLLASAKPRAMASPRPAPRAAPSEPRWNASKICSSSSSAIPGAVVDHTHADFSGRHTDLNSHGLGHRRVLQRVFEEVHQHPLDLLTVGTHCWRLLGERHLDSLGGLPEVVKSLDDEVVDEADRRLGLCAPPPGASKDRAGSRRAGRGCSRHRGSSRATRRGRVSSFRSDPARADCGGDRHQRRTEVVRDGAQNRGLRPCRSGEGSPPRRASEPAARDRGRPRAARRARAEEPACGPEARRRCST